MEYLTLNTGAKTPVLGFGTYQISPRDTAAAVETAIETGYRLIDTSQNYYNEQQVGDGIKASGIDRHELFLTTKVDTDGYEDTKRGIEESLKKLQTDYLDLMILHWPRPQSLGSYKALEEYYRAGTIKAIGLSNYNIQETKDLIARTEVMPAVDQIETNLSLQQGKMHKFLTDQGIIHEAWSPLAQGGRALNNYPTLKKIGDKYGKTGVQILLRFLTQEKIMTIPRSINPTHIKANFEVLDFQLTEDELKQIRALDQHRSAIGWPANMVVDA